MVGGGQGSLIGNVHRIASRIDDRYELVAGALSSDPARALQSALDLGIDKERSYADFAQMAEKEAERDDGIDAVSIVTPNHLHSGPIESFAARGIHVICDKPLCDTMENAKQAKKSLEDNNVCFLLTHNYTGYPLVREARAMVAAGEIGDVRYVRATYIQGWLSTDVENQGVKQAEWRTDPKRSGPVGCVGDIGTHAFHIARYVTGLELERVAADLTSFVPGRKLDDHADILLRYEGGAKGVLSCSQISLGHENGLSFGIYGTKGSLRWEQEHPNQMTVCTGGNEPVRQYSRGLANLGPWAAAATRIPPGHPEGYLEAFAQLYSDVAVQILARINGIESGIENAAPFPGIDDGMAGMAFSAAALESSNGGSAWTEVEGTG